MTFVYAFATTFVFVGQGFTIGTIYESEDTAKQINQLIIMLMFATSGILGSTHTPNNNIMKGLTKVSPSRFSTEGIFRRLTFDNVPDLTYKDSVVDRE